MTHKKKETTDFVPLHPIDLKKVKNFSGLGQALKHTAFGGRQLGEAIDVTEAMVKDKKCFTVLTLSGAMTMAKMGLVICDMIDNGMVDAVVSTGALMSHGFIEAAGFVHYKNPGHLTDEELYEKGLNRVYDTLEPETNFEGMDEIAEQVFEKLESPVCSYTITHALGEYLHKNVKGRGVLKSAYEKNIPVFIPAFTDSEMGLDWGIFNRKRKIAKKEERVFDPFLDLERYADLVFKAKKLGIFTIGGGVPRNWAQQISVYLDLIERRILQKDTLERNHHFKGDNPYLKPFSYGVRICPEPVHWGGLSGCTYSEGISWGKFVPQGKGGKFAEVLCDATIAWPIVVKAVLERLIK